MRSARVELGSGGGSSGNSQIRSFLVRSASDLSCTTNAVRLPQPRSLVRSLKPFIKNPSVATSKRSDRERQKKLKTSGSRKHAVSFCPCRCACLLQQRAGYKVTSPIQRHK